MYWRPQARKEMQNLSDSWVGNGLLRSMDIDKEGNRMGLDNSNNNKEKFTDNKKRFLEIKTIQRKLKKKHCQRHNGPRD